MERPVPTNSTIHLCLDMQVMFDRGGPWPTPWMERVLPNVVRLTERMPLKTVFTRFIPPMRATDMTGMWREFYRKWPKVTRQRLAPEFLELVPQLRRFAPPPSLSTSSSTRRLQTDDCTPGSRSAASIRC